MRLKRKFFDILIITFVMKMETEQLEKEKKCFIKIIKSKELQDFFLYISVHQH